MHHKILIIDGHPVYILKLEGFLRGLTFSNIELASTGKEGVEKLGSYVPDLVILSGMLPDMDALKLCQRIKEISRTIKIIVQIGLFTEVNVVDLFHKSGADAVLARKEKNMTPLQEAVEHLTLRAV